MTQSGPWQSHRSHMYLRTKLATDWAEPAGDGLLIKVMRSFIPEANPGYRDKMHLIDSWYIEFDEQGLPGREVGVDAAGQTIVAGPSSVDYGFWLDTNMRFSDFDCDEIEKHVFEALWEQAGIAS